MKKKIYKMDIHSDGFLFNFCFASKFVKETNLRV